MKKDLKKRLVNRKVKKPSPWLMSIGFWVMGILNRRYGVCFSYDCDLKQLRDKPTVLLSSHASRLEFLYTVYGFGRKDINVVCGYQNILQKGLYPLLIKVGVISKYLYQPDFLCVKNMVRTLRRGGAVGLFPEGIQSTGGALHPINPATARFIKTCKANIVVATTRGAYMATPRYTSDRKKGYIGVHYSLLFTPEQLETYTEEQIYKLLLERIYYNDFQYNKTARHAYVGKKPNAFGIDRILYKCPTCQKERVLHVENDAIVCAECGFRARVNDYYELIDAQGGVYPFDINQWVRWQRSCVAQQVKDPSFRLELKGKLCTLRVDKLRRSPKNRLVLSVGTATLTADGLSFKGTLNTECTDFSFPAGEICSLNFSTRNYLEFYHNNEYFMLVPDTENECLIQWTLASEELHSFYDNSWRSARDDVYEYSKRGALWTD